VCGISGILSFSSGLKVNYLQDVIQRQTKQLSHRGPDAEGYFIEDGIAMGHRRLSIIDLHNEANQPLFDSTGRYVIVFNGEIYNYQTLKQEIKGYPWQTTSDTEVILAAYQKWGADCLKFLNGMYAFAIWDRTKKELFIARDRLGVKPFYYNYNAKKFIFASEIRAILATGMVVKELNSEAIIDILSFQAVKTPRSIVSGIQQLPPGCCALLNKAGFSIKQYWSIVEKKPSSTFNLSFAETIEKTKLLFTEAVKSRMVADVPVSAFLSGGIDSSAIVGVMAGLSTQPIETYSIIFNEEEFDESKYARIIAEKYKTKHTELLLSPSKLLDELPAFFSSMDSPTTDGINTYIVSKLVAQAGGKVALSGLGGDELFGGYQGFKRHQQFNEWANPQLKTLSKLIIPLLPKNRQGNKIVDLISANQWNLSTFYNNSRAIFLQKEIKNLGLESKCQLPWLNLRDSKVTNYPLLSQYSIAELTNYTLDVLLKDTDQMSMASALEIREPFFDYHLIEFLLSVPDKFKYNPKISKSLLVKALGDVIPLEIINRPKKGFTFPWSNWLKTDLSDFCTEHINSLSKRDIFDKKVLFGLLTDFEKGKNGILWLHIWALVTIEAYLIKNNL